MYIHRLARAGSLGSLSGQTARERPSGTLDINYEHTRGKLGGKGENRERRGGDLYLKDETQASPTARPYVCFRLREI